MIRQFHEFFCNLNFGGFSDIFPNSVLQSQAWKTVFWGSSRLLPDHWCSLVCGRGRLCHDCALHGPKVSLLSLGLIKSFCLFVLFCQTVAGNGIIGQFPGLHLWLSLSQYALFCMDLRFLSV